MKSAYFYTKFHKSVYQVVSMFMLIKYHYYYYYKNTGRLNLRSLIIESQSALDDLWVGCLVRKE